jgi:hypothetical protein
MLNIKKKLGFVNGFAFLIMLFSGNFIFGAFYKNPFINVEGLGEIKSGIFKVSNLRDAFIVLCNLNEEGKGFSKQAKKSGLKFFSNEIYFKYDKDKDKVVAALRNEILTKENIVKLGEKQKLLEEAEMFPLLKTLDYMLKNENPKQVVVKYKKGIFAKILSIFKKNKKEDAQKIENEYSDVVKIKNAIVDGCKFILGQDADEEISISDGKTTTYGDLVYEKTFYKDVVDGLDELIKGYDKSNKITFKDGAKKILSFYSPWKSGGYVVIPWVLTLYFLTMAGNKIGGKIGKIAVPGNYLRAGWNKVVDGFGLNQFYTYVRDIFGKKFGKK